MKNKILWVIFTWIILAIIIVYYSINIRKTEVIENEKIVSNINESWSLDTSSWETSNIIDVDEEIMIILNDIN